MSDREEVGRVIITRPVHGLVGMQVCAADDATDDEILTTCNRDNPAGTERGWVRVIRDGAEEKFLPVPCSTHPERRHFLVTC